jgi:tripartite-type tricarboxylate transporter receptor subunit TctC
MHSITRSGRRTLFALAAAGLTRTALAQKPWRPMGPMRLLVGFPPGGLTDILARTVAPLLQARFEQSFVVENRSGAAGGWPPRQPRAPRRTARRCWSGIPRQTRSLPDWIPA